MKSCLSKKARKQQGNICQVCDSKENLTVHHLYPQAVYQQYANKIFNLICLCRSCHDSYHQAYDIETNNPNQFQAWAKKHPKMTKAHFQEKVVPICQHKELRRIASQLNSKSASGKQEKVSTFTAFSDQTLYRLIQEYCQRRQMSSVQFVIDLLEYDLECASAKLNN